MSPIYIFDRYDSNGGGPIREKEMLFVAFLMYIDGEAHAVPCEQSMLVMWHSLRGLKGECNQQIGVPAINKNALCA